MSYGAPCEQDVGEADPTLLLSLEGPGLVPGASGSTRRAKKALKARYQRKKRRRLREEAAARKVRCVNDQDRPGPVHSLPSSPSWPPPLIQAQRLTAQFPTSHGKH